MHTNITKNGFSGDKARDKPSVPSGRALTAARPTLKVNTQNKTYTQRHALRSIFPLAWSYFWFMTSLRCCWLPPYAPHTNLHLCISSCLPSPYTSLLVDPSLSTAQSLTIFRRLSSIIFIPNEGCLSSCSNIAPFQHHSYDRCMSFGI